MAWSIPRAILPVGGPWSELDEAGASGPCVVESIGGSTRLWYSGHDGSTSRILVARLGPGHMFERSGIAIDVAFAGETDAYGVSEPVVVRTPGGYLLAYAGSDGPDTRLHMATSPDGEHWEPHGTFMQREGGDGVGASHPSLVTNHFWWLFYAGFDGSDNGRRATIMAAISDTGASWDRLGTILEPQPGEVSVRDPSVLATRGGFRMFFCSDDGVGSRIDLATSIDGLRWSRRGTTIEPGDIGRRVRSPFAIRGWDGCPRLLFSAPGTCQPTDPDRLWIVEGRSASVQ